MWMVKFISRFIYQFEEQDLWQCGVAIWCIKGGQQRRTTPDWLHCLEGRHTSDMKTTLTLKLQWNCALLPMTGQFQDQVPDYVINIKYVLEGILIPIIGSIGVWGNLCKSRIRSMLLCVHCVGKIVV